MPATSTRSRLAGRKRAFGYFSPIRIGVVAAAVVIPALLGSWWLLWRTPPMRLTLAAVGYQQLEGWGEDRLAAALPAFLASCAAFSRRPDAAPLDPIPKRGDFGTIAEWRPLCRQAAALPVGEDGAARRFFEAGFAPVLAGNNGAPDGLFTGYFEISLNGSRRREGPYQTPLYRRPPEPGRYSRAEIEDGALAGQGLELLWVDNPVDAFFLHIQGSGQVRLRQGGTVRVGYDGANGRPFIPVGRLLLERGVMAREELTMRGIRQWMAHHPEEGAALRREDPSYVFFRELHGDGPIGAETVVLTAGRSLAVDRAFLPLGVPIWLDARERFGAATHRRLVVAQDTGGAIKGPVRGDLFWGSGDAAGEKAGAMNARGRYYVLLPQAVAARWRDD